MNEVIRGSWATVKLNSDLILVRTNSGYRSGTHADPKGKQHFLQPDASDAALGCALLDAMAQSRWVLGSPRDGSVYPLGVEFDADLYDYRLNLERYAEWTRSLMDRYGYKTKRALFEKMKNCYVEAADGLITIMPSHHEKLEMWSGEGISESDYVVIPADSEPAQIGAALRLALRRCT